ncbi:AAA family ATPase [Bacillus thuringiensis]|nr:AAA family ATPase [Bacillus thuringiensis]
MLKGFYNIGTLDFLEYCDSEKASMIFIDLNNLKGIPDIKSSDNSVDVKEYFSYLAKIFQQVRRVLSSRGNFIVVTDENYANYISIILENVFGVENFRSQFKLNDGISHVKRKNARIVLHFTKSENYINNLVNRELTEQEFRRFNNKDEKGLYYFVSLFQKIDRKNSNFEWRGCTPPYGYSWKYSSEVLERYFNEGLIVVEKNGKPKLKRHLKEKEQEVSFKDLQDYTIRSNLSIEQLVYELILMGSNKNDLIIDLDFQINITFNHGNKLGRFLIGCSTSETVLKKVGESIELMDSEFKIYSRQNLLNGNLKKNSEYKDLNINFDFKSKKTIRMRAVSVKESQFITCLKNNVWGSNNSHLKNWYIGDYIVFIVDKEIVALAKVSGEQFKSDNLIWNNGDYPFRLPISFIKVLSYKDRLAVKGEIKELLQGEWQNYGIPIRNKLLLPNNSSESLLSLFKDLPDSTNEVLNTGDSNDTEEDSIESNENISNKEEDIKLFKELNIYKWRQFEKVEIKFHRRMTILTGANGSGKTTLINFLNKHFGWKSECISTPEKDKKLSRIKYTSGIWGGNEEALSIGKIIYNNSKECEITIPQNISQTYEVEIENINLLKGLHIPSHRTIYRFNEIKNIPTRIRPLKEIFEEYSDTVRNDYNNLNSERSPIYILKESLISMAMFGFGNEIISQNIFALDLFREFEEILRKVLPPKLGFLSISIQMPDVILNTKSGDFSLDGVSGGIASIIDLAWVIFLYNRLGEKFIVTIDEPENHLHPEMQRMILPALLEAFPDIQFIVVTHNPFIISSVPDSHVYALNYNENNKVYSTLLDMVSKAGSSNEILRDVLGLPYTMPIWVEDKLKKIVDYYSDLEFNDKLIDELSNEMDNIGLGKYIPLTISNIYKEED